MAVTASSIGATVLTGVQARGRACRGARRPGRRRAACGQGRGADFPIGGVGDDDDVAVQVVPVGRQEVSKEGSRPPLPPRRRRSRSTAARLRRARRGVRRAWTWVMTPALSSAVPGRTSAPRAARRRRGRPAPSRSGRRRAGRRGERRGAREGSVGPPRGPGRRAGRGPVGDGHRADLALQTAPRQEPATVSAQREHLDLVVAGGGDRRDRDEVVRSETTAGMEVCTAVRTASTVIMVFRVSCRCR